jgi:hypothetical protein
LPGKGLRRGDLLKVILAAMLALTGLSAARAEVFRCAMQVGDTFQGNTVAPEIFLTFVGDEVTVMDAIIDHFNKGAPIVAKTLSKKEKSHGFQWSVFMSNKSGQRTKMHYSGTFFTQTHEFHLRAKPAGYSNDFSAVGHCAPDRD